METQGNRSTTRNDKIRTAIFVLIVSTIICVSSLIEVVTPRGRLTLFSSRTRWRHGGERQTIFAPFCPMMDDEPGQTVSRARLSWEPS
jgi:hypothetical protein